jgi:hypothetical protein
MKEQEKNRLKTIITEMVMIMDNVIDETQDESLWRIRQDFMKATTIKEKIWIAQAFEESI